MKYYLRSYVYKLADVNVARSIDDELILVDFKINLDEVKVFENFEEAEEIRKLIFIETGLNMEIKKYERENN